MPSSNSFGVVNGIYWFKLIIDTNLIKEDAIIYIPTHNLKYIELYRIDGENVSYISKSGNSVSKKNLAFDYKYPAFKINKKDLGITYYMKAYFPKEANFPIKVLDEHDFFNHSLLNQSFIFLYYGTCLMVLLINLMFFYKFKNRIFIYYALFLLSVTGGMLLYDGTLIRLQNLIPLGDHFEFLFRLLECATLILFSIKYLELKDKTPRFVKLTLIFPLIIILNYILYLLTDNYTYVAIGDVIAISVFIVFWVLGFGYWKQMLYAKFYVLGYLLLLPVGIFFFAGYGFGWWKIDGENYIVKIAGWFEMIVFTYALFYRMKVKDNENIEMISSLKLTLTDMKEMLTVKTNDVDPYFIFLKENDFTIEPLTMREIEILKYLNEGLTNPQIGENLFISTNTVKSHVRNIYNKLDIKNRNQLQGKVSEII
jgi:DNA-binding CsgD family transcriptional regulator